MASSAKILQSSRKEATVTAIIWLLACGWTVGYSAVFGYRPGEEQSLIAGIPSWVVWGIAAPWTACTLFTIWFATCGMRDEDLENEPNPAVGADPEGADHG